MAHGVEVKITARTEQLDLFGERVAAGLTDQVDERGIVELDFRDARLFGVARVSEVQDAALIAVVHTGKLLAAADRPVDGIGVDAQLTLDLLRTSSSGSRVSRSILLIKVKMGILRRAQTLKSLRVCGSTPFAPSMTITALSAAISVR